MVEVEGSHGMPIDVNVLSAELQLIMNIVTLLGYRCNHSREQGNSVTYAPTRGQILQH